ncbi:MAG: AzlD domain-containing protein, partial [Gammaproteobacteria bacterium]
MTDTEIWITIIVLALATAATRSSFWLVGHHINIPKRVQDMLRYAPACALAAIVAPDLLLDGAGTVEEVDPGERVLAPGQPVVLHPAVACGRCEFCHRGEVVLCTGIQYLGEHRDGT